MIHMDDRLSDADQLFLQTLFNHTQGDASQQVSMYDIGQQMGMEKDVAAQHAENLMGLGLVEIKTLSGGIGISAAGIEKSHDLGWGGNSTQSASLGQTTVIDDDLRRETDQLLAELKTGIGSLDMSYPTIADLVTDIRTMEVQLMHAKPKTVVIRACLLSAAKALQADGHADLGKRLDDFAGE